ncbi:hypothetical protein OsJ_33479 [Oryza sativa Japonica Group]|uniref:Uncharacterized protein n=1 Tax=Oryza sativa subsp. japonica TaxID=39947 RepID=B9GA38_ORYSJ|nr:hypothetical protein OsJ_33479 [Oryza sativa Japonica Group]
MAAACADLSRSVARLSARCADPLLRQFDAPFAALVRGGLADLHRLQSIGCSCRRRRHLARLATVDDTLSPPAFSTCYLFTAALTDSDDALCTGSSHQTLSPSQAARSVRVTGHANGQRWLRRWALQRRRLSEAATVRSALRRSFLLEG